jgi:hypothetical protein
MNKFGFPRKGEKTFFTGWVEIKKYWYREKTHEEFHKKISRFIVCHSLLACPLEYGDVSHSEEL